MEKAYKKFLQVLWILIVLFALLSVIADSSIAAFFFFLLCAVRSGIALFIAFAEEKFLRTMFFFAVCGFFVLAALNQIVTIVSSFF
ncbi:hypothetical protein [Bacillus massiliglaciei]|uniref:hypothetical protein n=1 Tax=Bacillus massiliglaciei TaxID=1816693 RepID=UPI000DA5F0F8|nr:hypothetical protein [Bacillus massiliglaciei]